MRTWLRSRRSDVALSADSRVVLTSEQEARRDAVQQTLIVMVLVTTVLTVLGVFMVFSATSPSSIRLVDRYGSEVKPFSVAINHAMYAVVGVVLAFIASKIPSRWYQRGAYALFALGLVLQLGVVFFGKETLGNRNWLQLGPVQFQPSEFLKLAMIVWLAHILSRLHLREEGRKTLILALVGFGLAVGLVILPGDMGTALIYIMIGAGMFWLAGIAARYFVLFLVAASLLGGIFVALRPSRLSRVYDFLTNLTAQPDLVAPTQSEFAQFAFGSGGITGVGLGAGKEKWRDLQEAHTDFIFAVIGEELGLFGTLAVVALFLVLAWCFLRLALNQSQRFAQLFTAGAGLWICGQAFTNMAVVTGIFPVFGVPLPLISQGGSSVVAVLLTIGVTISCASSVPGVAESLKIRPGIAHRAKATMMGARYDK